MSERKVKLPGLPAPTAANLAQVVRLLVERAEVREGARGDELEAVVTRRDLAGSGFVVLRGNSANGGVLVQGPGGEATLVPLDAFGDQLRKTAAYQSLLTRLDDINRFANLPDQVRALLAEDLALEAARRQADIQRIDHKSQSATESLAYALQVVTAAVAGASAGVREVTFASATANTATAGQITQLQARLNGVAINPVDILPTVYATLAALQAAVPVGAQGKYYQVAPALVTSPVTPPTLYAWNGTAYVVSGKGTTATMEQSMTVTADRIKGVSGEYLVKINAGGAAAGFGLSASEDPTGATRSAFIIQADTFALISAVTFTQVTTPTATAIGQTWYNPTSKLYYRATATGTASWVLAPPTVPFGVDTVTNTTFINGSLRINSGGSTLLESVGRYTDYIFRRSATVPATPTGDTPASWFDTPPTGTDPLYMSRGNKTAAGVLIGAWSAPARLEGAAGAAGATGGVGATGASGVTTYTWIAYADNATGSTGFTTGAWTNQTHIGLATNKTTATESTTPGDYTWSLIKGEQGVAGGVGATGANGLRGTVTAYATGSIWSDSVATNKVYAVTSTAYLLLGDTVTISNGTTFAETRYWGGASWLTPGVVIDGNLLVTGTIAASKLVGAWVSASRIGASGNYGEAYMGGSVSPPLMSFRSAVNTNLEALYVGDLVAHSGTMPLVNFDSRGAAGTIKVTAEANNAIAMKVTSFGTSSGAAQFFNNNGSASVSSKEFWAAPGGYSAYAPAGKGKFYPIDGTGPFTGFHDGLLLRTAVYALGDIVVDTAILYKPDINNTLSAVALSTTPNQKTAIGIISAVREIDEFLTLSYEAWWAYVEDYLMAEVNAVGEGQINVCGEGGDLEPGDLIVTSGMPGKGMRQSDDLIRNTTVAKCRESVTFANPAEVKMVACIYLCG